MHFAEAAVEAGPGMPGGCHDDPALEEARQKVLAALGPDALVDACATVANFQRMDRIADATGVPLDGSVDLLTADVREELGIDAYAAESTRSKSGIKRALGRALRQAALGVAKAVAKLRG